MAQLEELLEELRQLKAANEQLKGQVETLTAATTAPVTNSQPGRSSTMPLEVVAPTSEPETIVTRFVHVPTQRKCPKFTGKLSVDLMTVEKWIEEARRCLEVRHLPLAEQVLFAMDHVEGGARSELEFHPLDTRNTPEKIFKLLLDNFSCSQSYVTAQLQLYQRSQKEGESIREYSYALKSLMDIVTRKTPGGVPNSDRLLRDQFLENVLDETLRRELKKQVATTPEISFVSLRSVAIKWGEEERTAGKTRPRAYSCDTYMHAVRSEGEVNAVGVKTKDDMSELRDCFRKQQAQLDAIMKHLGMSSQTGSQPREQPSSSRPYPYTSDGKPVCLRCNRDGHIARFCRVDTKTLHNQTRRVDSRPPAHSQTVGAANIGTEPAGN